MRTLFFLSISICFALAVLIDVANGGSHLQHGKESVTERWIVWEEIEDEQPAKAVKSPKVPRCDLLLWRRKRESRQQIQKSNEEEEELQGPHPLRTDLWEIQMNWRQRAPGRQKSSLLLLEFSSNGYVRLSNNLDQSDGNTGDNNNKSDSTTIAVGSWKLTPTNLFWSLPKTALILEKQSNLQQEEFVFGGDFHLNPFGNFPKLTRGVVISSDSSSSSSSSLLGHQKKWFRPVVATFTARGIGKDTADWSYQHRKR